MERYIECCTLFGSPDARTNEKRAESLSISKMIEMMHGNYLDMYLWTMRKAGL